MQFLNGSARCRLKSAWRNCRSYIAGRSAVAIAPFVPSPEPGSFGILMYHRVTERPRSVPAPTYNVTPHQFRKQLQGLLQRGYRPQPLRRLIDLARSGRAIEPKSFAVTFDDGYECLYSQAWPILRELQIPATIFLVTSALDTDRRLDCDDWIAAGDNSVPPESWRSLTTAQCREMRDSGLIDLGAHTHTHADFRGRPQRFYEDLRLCVRTLRERFGMREVTFAFPFGNKHTGHVTPALVEAARRAGVLCSLTTEAELVGPGSDPFDWGRFAINQTDTATTIVAKLENAFTWLRTCWKTVCGSRYRPNAPQHPSSHKRACPAEPVVCERG